MKWLITLSMSNGFNDQESNRLINADSEELAVAIAIEDALDALEVDTRGYLKQTVTSMLAGQDAATITISGEHFRIEREYSGWSVRRLCTDHNSTAYVAIKQWESPIKRYQELINLDKALLVERIIELEAVYETWRT